MAQSSGCDVVPGTEAYFEQQASPNASPATGEEVDVPAGDTPPRNDADSPSIASDSAASEGGSVPATLRYESPHVTQPAGRPLADSSGSEYSPSPRRNLRDAFAGEMERGDAKTTHLVQKRRKVAVKSCIQELKLPQAGLRE
ncbi:hypothetical protein DVH05_003682 [Phytophthora capsici]|nr:hypothetical protein DVH05_012174 [Phytophthora capsici]KAG1688480.1 hypothetical protein DVH05_003682 [Phytophthora capsici]